MSERVEDGPAPGREREGSDREASVPDAVNRPRQPNLQNYRFDERALHYFALVCDRGSIRAAATFLGIAPSAISRKLAELEFDIGMPLLEKSARGVVKTEPGELLHRHLRDRSRRDLDFLAQIAALHGLKRGKVRIIAGEGYVFDLMHNALDQFLREHPGIIVDVTISGTDQIVNGVLNNEYDLGIAFNPPASSHLTVLAESRDALCVVTSLESGLAAREALHFGEVAGIPCAVLSLPFGVRHLLQAAERARGICLNKQMETNSIHALKVFALSGRGITFLPRFALQSESGAQALAAVPLLDEEFHRVCSQILSRADRGMTPAIAAVAKHLSATMVAFQGPLRSVP